MYIYIYKITCIYIYIYICIQIHIHISTYSHLSIHMYTYIHVYILVFTYIPAKRFSSSMASVFNLSTWSGMQRHYQLWAARPANGRCHSSASSTNYQSLRVDWYIHEPQSYDMVTPLRHMHLLSLGIQVNDAFFAA